MEVKDPFDDSKWASEAAEARRKFYEHAEKEGLLEEVSKKVSAPKYDHSPLIYSPVHYQSNTKLEVIDIIDAFDLGAYEANIVKYVLRYKKKNGVLDLKKASWYLERLIKKQELVNNKRTS